MSPAPENEPLPRYVLAALESIGIERNTEYPEESDWITNTEPHGAEPSDSLRDALGTMLRASENDGRSGERERLTSRIREVLAAHWLTEIQCHHDTKTDTAHCYCTIWSSGALPSVGHALNAWIEHVMEQLPVDTLPTPSSHE